MYTITGNELGEIGKQVKVIKSTSTKIVSHNHISECMCSKLIDDIKDAANKILSIVNKVENDDD